MGKAGRGRTEQRKEGFAVPGGGGGRDEDLGSVQHIFNLPPCPGPEVEGPSSGIACTWAGFLCRGRACHGDKPRAHCGWLLCVSGDH